MFKKTALVPLISLFFFCSCSSNKKESKPQQGIIEFEISYPSIAEDDIMLEFLPRNMEFVFKNSSYRNNIVAGMGLFSTSFINNKENNSITQTVKLLNSKYASILTTENLIDDPNFSNLEIEMLEGDTIIAGYRCNTARITVHGDSTWTYLAFYTKDIDIKDPNHLTPFEKIDGVLLDYQIIKYNLHMHFKATEIIPKEIPGSIAEIDGDYESVSAEKLGLEIKNIFAKLNE